MFYRFRDHEYNELMPGGLNAHHFEFAFFMWSFSVLSLFENITLQSVVYKNFTISLTLLFPGVAKTEFLLIISIQYQRDKWGQ